jgi:NAD(P)-dependent dehydrogenase (short-subunit alcohol dehydrogenase family)
VCTTSPLHFTIDSNLSLHNSFHQEEQQLDILVNNAGVAGIEKTISSEGFEMVFVTNHLGHFLLTNLLLDTMKVMILHNFPRHF